MSTFSGLGTALSSLIAQRQALEVTGQNIANANTVGYTRQRAAISSLPAAQLPSMFSASNGPGYGTAVTDIARLNDVFLDAQVRTTTASSSFLSARASASKLLETNIGEPAATGLATQLTGLWAAFGDVANSPNKDSSRAVLLETAAAVADRIGTLYTAAGTQWAQARTQTTSLVAQANTSAANIADLNKRILAIENSGSSANELKDQRDLLVTELSGLVGATTRTQENGQIDVLVGGNLLVDGSKVRELAVTGAVGFADATGGDDVKVVWAADPTRSAGLEGGQVAGLLSVLAPPAAGGTGGLLTEAAASYDKLATQLATQVNGLHRQAVTIDGAQGGDFFDFTAGQPAALGLKVAFDDPALVAVAAPGAGALDGSFARQIAQLGTAVDGPDATWSAFVVQLGVSTASATSRATAAEATRASAAAQQVAQTSVDSDEETVNMLAYQRAYEGAARVLSAIDEMLDTLINRTGIVGR